MNTVIFKKIRNLFVILTSVSFLLQPSFASEPKAGDDFTVSILKKAGNQLAIMGIKELFNYFKPEDMATFSQAQMDQFRQAIRDANNQVELGKLESSLTGYYQKIKELDLDIQDDVPKEPAAKAAYIKGLIDPIRTLIDQITVEKLPWLGNPDITGKAKYVLYPLFMRYYAAKISFLYYILELRERYKFNNGIINKVKNEIAGVANEMKRLNTDTYTYISQVMVPKQFTTPYYIRGAQGMHIHGTYVHFKEGSGTHRHWDCMINDYDRTGRPSYPNGDIQKWLQKRTFPYVGPYVSVTYKMPCFDANPFDITDHFKNRIFRYTEYLRFEILGNMDNREETIASTNEIINDMMTQSCSSNLQCGQGTCRNKICDFARTKYQLPCRTNNDCGNEFICSLNLNRCIRRVDTTTQWMLNEGEVCENNPLYKKVNANCNQNAEGDCSPCREGLACIANRCVDPKAETCYIGAPDSDCGFCANESDVYTTSPHHCIKKEDYNTYRDVKADAR